MRTSHAHRGMRERPINPTVYPPWRRTRGTRGLLSIGTTSGYGFYVRSIQYSRMANLRAAATFATRFRLGVTAMLILFAKLGIVTHCNRRCFHQQHAQHAIALLGNRSQLLPSARRVLARNQSQVTGHLLAAGKAA